MIREVTLQWFLLAHQLIITAALTEMKEKVSYNKAKVAPGSRVCSVVWQYNAKKKKMQPHVTMWVRKNINEW